ncbi:hypothetical protein YC2023_060803 [Brassica napus]
MAQPDVATKKDLLDVMAVGNPTMQRMLSERRAALGLPVRDPEESDPNRQQPRNPTDYFENIYYSTYLDCSHPDSAKGYTKELLKAAYVPFRGSSRTYFKSEPRDRTACARSSGNRVPVMETDHVDNNASEFLSAESSESPKSSPYLTSLGMNIKETKHKPFLVTQMFCNKESRNKNSAMFLNGINTIPSFPSILSPFLGL